MELPWSTCSAIRQRDGITSHQIFTNCTGCQFRLAYSSSSVRSCTEYTHRRKHRRTGRWGGDAPSQKSQCGGRQCYSSPDFDHLRREKRHNLTPKIHQNPFFSGSAPNPAGGAYSAPPDLLAGGEGGAGSLPLPKNPTPALSPSGFLLRPFGPRFVPPLFGPWLRL